MTGNSSVSAVQFQLRAAQFATGARTHEALRQRMSGTSRSGDPDPDDAGLRGAASELEAIFVKRMLTEMRRTVPDGGLMEGGFAQDIFTERLDTEWAARAAESGSLGLGALLYRQLRR